MRTLTRQQVVAIISAVLLFFVLYFGCDTRPPKVPVAENPVTENAADFDAAAMLKRMEESLSPEKVAALQPLTAAYAAATDSTARIAALENLSGFWFEAGRPDAAGIYARQIAELTGSDERWSVAGATFFEGIPDATDPVIKKFCTDNAIHAFENAYSINPAVIAHKVNIALCYAENPPADMPMKGPLMLIEMDKQSPGQTPILMALARLALKTGQYEKAIGRLQQVLTTEPDNNRAICFIAQAFEGAGKTTEAKKYAEKCKTGSN